MAIEDFEAEQALDILARADEIRADASLMTAITTVAQKKLKLAIELTGGDSNNSNHPDRDREERIDF